MALRAEERRDKLRKAAGEEQISIDPRMSEWGNPAEQTLSLCAESIGVQGEPRELKHLSTWRKERKLDFLSSGERKGRSLNRCASIPGLWTARSELKARRMVLGKPAR